MNQQTSICEQPHVEKTVGSNPTCFVARSTVGLWKGLHDGVCCSTKELASVSQKLTPALCSWHLACTAVKIPFITTPGFLYIDYLLTGAGSWLSCLCSASKPDGGLYELLGCRGW